ncbi:thiosulfate oxidation carrier protein SoxY [Sulfitobacter sp. LCG007]
MELTRRQTLALGMAAGLTLALPLRAFAEVEQVGSIEEFTGGAAPSEGGVTLTAPEIAENGNTVPISVDAPGAVEIRVFAKGNPQPGVASFRFGPLAGSQTASTRIRLSGTQDVVAVAKMADGSFAQATKTVKVTIGGCGG